MEKAFNFTPYPLWNRHIIRGEGCYVVDNEGRRYLDMESGVWCAALGHNNPHVNGAIIDQLGKISHVGYRYNSEVVEEAAENLLSILSMARGNCVFLNSGSEAVEFAVQAAKHLTGEGKEKLLCLDGYFLSSYGESAKRPSESWLSVEIPPEGEGAWKRQIDTLPFHEIGAFVFEPGNASGTVRLPSPEGIAYLTRKLREAGSLVVVDEVTTGMGRTGRWFGYQHYNLSPDIVACGKGLGNGYPVSAVAMKEGLGQRLRSGGFYYAQSHQNDPLGAAVVRAVIQQMESEDLIQAAADKGAYLLQGLRRMQADIPYIEQVRGRGLMVAVAFREGADLETIHRQLLEKGYLVGVNLARRVLRLYPPLVIAQEALQGFLQALAEVCKIEQSPEINE